MHVEHGEYWIDKINREVCARHHVRVWSVWTESGIKFTYCLNHRQRFWGRIRALCFGAGLAQVAVWLHFFVVYNSYPPEWFTYLLLGFTFAGIVSGSWLQKPVSYDALHSEITRTLKAKVPQVGRDANGNWVYYINSESHLIDYTE